MTGFHDRRVNPQFVTIFDGILDVSKGSCCYFHFVSPFQNDLFEQLKVYVEICLVRAIRRYRCGADFRMARTRARLRLASV